MTTNRNLLAVTILSLGLSSCGDAAGGTSLDLPLGLGQVARATIDPGLGNETTLARAELGKQLFYDPRLSASGKMSCASCHHADKAFTDGLPVSPKDDGSKNTRNTPSVYNTSFYTQGLYWDGRAATLEANVRAAWEKQMMGKPDEVAAKLNAVAGYKQQFEANYGGPADGDRIAKALAAFLRTLNSGGSAFDRWQFGGDQQAVDNDVKLGFELFKGKAGCFNCHTPPFFSDTGYHNTGVGMKAEKPDLGRGPIAKNEAMNGAFKTPSLRNVALTAPYFHDGSAKTLEEAVRHMASGGVENPTRDVLMVDRKLSDEEIRQLVKLLQALTSNPPFTPPTLPQ